jgi:hypothetical protein
VHDQHRITLDTCVPDEHQKATCGEQFQISAEEWRALAAQTGIVIDDDGDPTDDGQTDDRRATYLWSKRPPRPNGPAQVAEAEARQLLAVRVAVVGPVHVMFDPELRSQPRRRRPIVCVSIPAPNFKANESVYRKLWWDATTQMIRDAPTLRVVLSRMWYHILGCFRDAGVRYACLNAIGCGAFKGEVTELPAHYAATLGDLLCQHDFGLRAVILAVPTIAGDASNHTRGCTACAPERKAFEDALARCQSNLKVPVLLSDCHSMIDIADRLDQITQDNPDSRVGMLNPSDPLAIHLGGLGQNWEMGHIALEEIMALQTTLLAGNIGFNPDPWKNGKRVRFVNRQREMAGSRMTTW